VATIPMDQNVEKRSGGRRPISANRMFPAIVALWFATLLGLGSLIVPVQVIERLVGMTGIAGVFSAAAPPLGFTARVAVALMAAIFGALAGYAAARRITARGAKANLSSDPYHEADTLNLAGIVTQGDAPTVAVDTADDIAIVEDDTASEEQPASLGRRRSLTITGDDRPNDALIVVPLPGDTEGAAQHDHYAEVEDIAAFDAFPDPDNDEEYVADSEDAEAYADNIAIEEPVFAEVDESEDEAVEEQSSADIAEAETQMSVPPVEITQETVSPSEQDDDMPQPLAFSPPSLARNADAEDDSPQETKPAVPDYDTTSENEVNAASVDDLSDAEEEIADDQTERPDPASAANLAELGLVQLVQRLETVLEQHRAWSAERSVAAQAQSQAQPQHEPPVTREIAQTFAPAEPDEAADAMAAYFGQPADDAQAEVNTEEPVANIPHLSIIDAEEDEDEGEAEPVTASLTLPIGNAQPATTEPKPEPTDKPVVLVAAESPIPEAKPTPEASPVRDASYRALSAVDNPFRPQAHQARKAPAIADNDEALRDALLNLHRMAD